MLAPRRRSKKIRIGDVDIGGDAPVRVQSMTTTKTADINATLQQIASLVATGCEIVRVAVPHWEDAEALTAIAAKSTIPVVAGEPALGTWQRLIFFEMDEPKDRTITFHVFGG